MAQERNLEELKKHPAVIRLYNQKTRLQHQGREYKGHCPFHKDDTPSFTVYMSDGVPIWKCFGRCQKSGNIFQLLQEIDKIDFNQAVEVVEKFVGTTSWESGKAAAEEIFKPLGEKKKREAIPLAAYAKLETALENSEAAKKFLESRGIKLETAKNLRLGFRSNVGSIAGNSNHDIAASGWISLPCVQDGKVVSIKYRSIARKGFCREPGMDTALFNVEDVDPLGSLYVVAGEFDAAVLKQIGCRVVSLPSDNIKLSPEMRDQIRAADEIFLAGDSDASGLAIMEKLWADFGDKTYIIRWPDGLKDANEVFLKKSKGSENEFRDLVAELTSAARATPSPGVYNLAEVLMSSNTGSLLDRPDRFRFPWPTVDSMAILLPGSIAVVFATNTGMGKSTWLMNATLDAARKGEVVLNYQCELSQSEFANLAASFLVQQDRNTLQAEDRHKAGRMLAGVPYYVGYNSSLERVAPTLDLIESAIKRFGATVVILDHIHFICRNEDNEVSALANAMQRIKNMAVKYRVKFIVVGQPRKADKSTRGKVVHITDAKGSETLTSDADAVFAIHRDYKKGIDPANPPKYPFDERTEIHLLKARSQGEGNAFALLRLIGKTATFVEDNSFQYENVEDSQGSML